MYCHIFYSPCRLIMCSILIDHWLLSIDKRRFLYHADSNAPSTTLTCFNDEPVEVNVPASTETSTVAPPSLGVVVKVPPNPSEQNISFRTCSPSDHFVYPPGAKLASPIYHISTNPQVENDVEVLIEHNADVKTSKQANKMVFFVGEQSTDGSQKIKFNPKPGKFVAKKQHGSLTTTQMGFLGVGTTQPSKLSKLNLP